MSEKNKIIKSAGKPSEISKIIKKAGKPTKTTKKPKKISEAEKIELERYKAMTYKEKIAYNDKIFDDNIKKTKKLIRSKGYNSKKVMKYIKDIVGDEYPEIKPIKNLRMGGSEIISLRFYQKVSLEYVKFLTDELSNKLSKKNIYGKIATAMIYGDLGWKSGYLTKFGEDPKYYNPNELYNLEVPFKEPELISNYNMYLVLGGKPQGGNDIHNDCLYNCLKYYIFNIEQYYKSPADFKRQLKLNRDDKVSLDRIDMIEKKLKTYKINVRGEYIRTSTIKSNKEINLILKNEHYEVAENKRTYTPFIKYDEKKPIMWDKKTFEAYDGEKKWTMTKKERNDIIYNFKNENIIVFREDQGRDEEGEKIILSLEEEFDQFIVIADTLKKESKGLINLYKSGSYYSAALSLFDKITKNLNPEKILQDEAEFIKLNFIGGMTWAEEYEGPLYKYDIKSFYPYLMISNNYKFPVKRGEFKNIEDFHPEYFEYGIYRCKIYKSDNEYTNKLFKFNNSNYYNSIELTEAKKLGLKIELTKDEKPNFLYYSPDKLIIFSAVFKDYVEILFDLKNKNVNKSKSILNILWGALCEKNKRKQYIKDQFEIKDNEELVEIRPSNTEDDHHILKTVPFDNLYKNNYARLGPFLLAYGRRHINNILKDEIENVKRVQTDGFFTTKKIHENINVKIGELKYEGYTENGEIRNQTHQIKVHY